MPKKILTASVVVGVLFLVMDFVLHSVLLRGLYAETASLWRAPEALGRLGWIIWVVDVLIAFFFVWLYSKGLEAGKAWLGQGIRFGLVVGLIFSLPMGFSMYAMMPVPFSLGLGWFVGALVEFVVAGVAVAFVFRS
ncbi:MAG: hypothetical protein WCJ71_04650 [Candidatus Omnitrophota bacterium]